MGYGEPIWQEDDTRYLVRCESCDRDYRTGELSIYPRWRHHNSSTSVTRCIREVEQQKARIMHQHRKSMEEKGKETVQDEEISLQVIVYQIDYVLEDCMEKPVADPLVIYNGSTKDFPGFKNGRVKGT